MGHPFYTSSVFNMRIANYQAIMSKYRLFLWDHKGTYLGTLPEDQKSLGKIFQEEAIKLSRQQMNNPVVSGSNR